MLVSVGKSKVERGRPVQPPTNVEYDAYICMSLPTDTVSTLSTDNVSIPPTVPGICVIIEGVEIFGTLQVPYVSSL